MHKPSYYEGAIIACIVIVIAQSIIRTTMPWYTPLMWIVVFGIWEGVAALIRRRRRSKRVAQ